MEKYSLNTSPYTDNKAEWDDDEQLYIVDKDYFKKRTGIDAVEILGEQNFADAFSLATSHRLYNIIDSYANSEGKDNNIKVMRYILKHDYKYRDIIINALVSMQRAAIDTDIDRVGDEWTADRRAQLLQDGDIDLPLDTKRILSSGGLLSSKIFNLEVE